MSELGLGLGDELAFLAERALLLGDLLRFLGGLLQLGEFALLLLEREARRLGQLGLLELALLVTAFLGLRVVIRLVVGWLALALLAGLLQRRLELVTLTLGLGECSLRLLQSGHSCSFRRARAFIGVLRLPQQAAVRLRRVVRGTGRSALDEAHSPDRQG